MEQETLGFVTVHEEVINGELNFLPLGSCLSCSNSSIHLPQASSQSVLDFGAKKHTNSSLLHSRTSILHVVWKTWPVTWPGNCLKSSLRGDVCGCLHLCQAGKDLYEAIGGSKGYAIYPPLFYDLLRQSNPLFEPHLTGYSVCFVNICLLCLLIFFPLRGNYIALILVPDEVCRQEVVRDLSGHLFFFFACVCLLSSCVYFGSDADVSPVIGGRAPRLPSGVCFGSETDVIPSSGCRVPGLPVCLFACLACVSRTTVALILVRDEICRHRMRCPIELPSVNPICVPSRRLFFADATEGCEGVHAKGPATAKKILRAGYYWTTMEVDCYNFVKRCHKCQIYGDKIFVPPTPLNVLTSP
ncbi:hypothetical protein KIW84_055066 [Lathyrus oleraceus]|uniref:Integrase zinc-binding domain-containing protein n=1 Tax=Pisum sativum TaxID=3888 RepID=A0A9D4WX87_PEA|nr:hypothetical protein KIW84_055066 [Pisum sativum]